MNRFSALCYSVLFVSFMAGSPAYAGGVDALKAAQNGRWSQALSMAGNGIAKDVVTWMYLVDDDTHASFPQIASFVAQHPEWPDNKKLYKIAEARLPDDLSQTQILNWFSVNPPATASGMKRYMEALLSTQQRTRAVDALKKWWVEADMSAADQNDILANYSHYLGMDDHARRLERILTDKQYTPARALAARMGDGYMKLVDARYGLQEGGGGIESRINSLPRNLRDDAGLMLSRVQYRRQNDMDRDAVALLNNAPPASQTTDPAAWWKERNTMARRMMEQGNYREAYKLASHHGLAPEGQDYAAAEFLSGWLALRFLDKPYEAFEHFEKLFNNSATPITRARAAYWAGRASEAMNGRDIAAQWFQVAAGYQTTFYGQLAAEHIGVPLTRIRDDKPQISSAEQRAFNNRDMVQAAKLLRSAGMTREEARFIKAMQDAAKSPQDYSMLADFAADMGQTNAALKVAKEAEKAGLYLTDYSFPTLSGVGDYGVDKALVFALIRQESQFDAGAVSSSGALGLMQIMPATGKHTAQRNDLMHQTTWLTSKPDHNVKIGSLYIGELLKRFKGNLPLAIASYNAGPGRVGQWLKQLGDPRDGRIDMVDWIESIPVYETRNYVQRVMEGYAVYRIKMAGGGTYRGQPQQQLQQQSQPGRQFDTREAGNEPSDIIRSSRPMGRRTVLTAYNQ